MLVECAYLGVAVSELLALEIFDAAGTAVVRIRTPALYKGEERGRGMHSVADISLWPLTAYHMLLRLKTPKNCEVVDGWLFFVGWCVLMKVVAIHIRVIHDTGVFLRFT